MTDLQKKQGCPFVPPEVIPDRIIVPDHTILLIPENYTYVDPPHFIKAGKTRDWWTPYFYNCLPIVFGNQHGFLMLATYDFVVRWNGDNGLPGLKIHLLESEPNPNYILLSSHFGSGILTIQSRYTFRTPKGVNLMVKEPPNYFVDGFSWMNAVIETDNLRRDFTFNIKVTEPNRDIYVAKGTPLGCILPYPRYFLDSYTLDELRDPELLGDAKKTVSYFSTERNDFDTGPRMRYLEGIDIYNLRFEEHQKSLDMGAWWSSTKLETSSEPNNQSKSPLSVEGKMERFDFRQWFLSWFRF